MKSNSKAQASVEFIIFFGIMAAIFSGFMAVTNIQFETIAEKQAEIDAEALQLRIAEHARIASETGYIHARSITFPETLGSRNYESYLAQDKTETYIVINMTEYEKEFYHPLGRRVYGSVDSSLTPFHCIASNTTDEMISPYSVRLVPARVLDGNWRDIEEADYDSEGILEVRRGSKVSFYIEAGCIHSLDIFRARILFSGLSLDSMMESSTHKSFESGNYSMPFGGFSFIKDNIANCTFEALDGAETGVEIRINNTFPSTGPVGAGYLAEISFNTLEGGEKEIEIFVDEIIDKSSEDRDPKGESVTIRII